MILTGWWRHNIYYHESIGPDTPSTEKGRAQSLMRQTKSGAVPTAQDMSGELPRKQDMRVYIVHSNVNRNIQSAVPEPPRTRQDCKSDA